MTVNDHFPKCGVVTRRLILFTASLFLIGGAWQAAQCLGVNRQSLPMNDLAALAASLAATAAADPITASRLACSPSLQLTLLQFTPNPILLLDSGALCQRLGQSLASSALLPPVIFSAAALLHPPPPPPGGLARLASALDTRPLALQYGRQLLQLALETNQLPFPTGNASAATVLVYLEEVGGAADDAGAGAKEAAAAAGRDGSTYKPAAAQALELSEDVLAVFVGDAGRRGAVQEALQPALAGEVVVVVDRWLGQAAGSRDSSAGEAGATAAALAAACLGGAGALLAQLLSALRLLPDQPASQELASLASRAVRAASAAQHAQQQGQASLALSHAREAWGAAWGLKHHPGFGVQPVFPPEHQMAVVLPLALPVLLVVVRAAARELKIWKQERKAVAAAQRIKKVE